MRKFKSLKIMRKYRVERKKYPTYIRYGSEKKTLSYLYQIWEWEEKTILPISDMGVCTIYIRYGSFSYLYQIWEFVLPISEIGVCPTYIRYGSLSYLYHRLEFVLPISDMGVCPTYFRYGSLSYLYQIWEFVWED